MKTIPLGGKKAAGRVALVDDADYELVSQYRWHIRQSSRGTHNSGPYAETTMVHGSKSTGRQWVRILMHNLILGFKGVDHRNGDGLDNQRSNLRPATGSQNGANQRPQTGRTSRYKGVSWDRSKRKWVAQINTGGRVRRLGCFAAEEDAARAYDAAALTAWGAYARLNFEEDAWPRLHEK